ncbi:hypothetical protein ACFSO0_05495 [Brevibacillus sp. GCM10020057]|uniref:hypothetical protein n=1 Tax=Brevibacillus sp. GCM10020057 TaxID=3317327 RepID=UPI00363FAB3C
MGISSGFCAINAKQIEVKFSVAVDEDSVIDTTNDNGLIGNSIKIDVTGSNTNTITVDPTGDNSGGANATGELSKDGKTLTITAPSSEVFDGSYAITFIKDQVKDEEGNKLEETVQLFNAKDTVRPTFASVKYSDNKTAVLTFSEPLQDKGTVSFKVAADGSALPANGQDGSNPPVTANLTAEGIKIDLSNLNDNLKNKDITVTVVGAVDYAGLVLSPNPFTQNIKYSTEDTTAPTVASVTALSNKAVEVKFSEELSADPTITIGGTATTLKKDATDKTKYVATLATGTSGLQTVVVSAFTDKSGNAGTTFSKVVNFDVDTTKPVVASTKVEKINGVEYLVITFNENVDVTAADGQKLTFN